MSKPNEDTLRDDSERRGKIANIITGNLSPLGKLNTIDDIFAQYTEQEVDEAYRKGYNANSRDCYCHVEVFMVTPHRHLMGDGKSHNIRPDIRKLAPQEPIDD